MNTETEYLQTIAEEIVNHKTSDETKANYHLEVEAKRLEKAIIHALNHIENFTQRDTFHFNTLSKLVNICDILFDATGTVSPNVMVLISLLTVIKQVIPDEVRPGLKLPKAFLEIHKPEFAKIWAYHTLFMQEQNISEQLIEIAGIPFRRFTEPKQKLFWGDYTWLKGYQAKLDIMDWQNADCNSPEEALLSLLIGRDFNDDRFYIYCKKYINERTKAATGKRQRMLAYAECEKLVLEDTQAGMPSFDSRANSVSTRLIKYIREEIDYVETHEREVPRYKFEFKWSVEVIACFFKLLHERKVFGHIKLERFSEVIAANCTSMDKDEIQASTVYSRFYKKDMELLKAVRKILKDLLDDLDNLLS